VAGEKHPVWRLVEGMLRMARDRMENPRDETAPPDTISSDRAP
jgi:hypothetical protein